MLSLSKKQVKSLLEVISSDDTRPILQQAKIDEYNGKPVLVATDGYVLVALDLSDREADGEKIEVGELIGKMIDRSELLKWYKLSGARDILTEFDLQAMPDNRENVGEYPVWQKLIPDEKNFSAVATTGINANYLLTLQTLSGAPGMTLQFFGKLTPIVLTPAHQHYNNDNTGVYIIMPLKV